MKRVALTIPKPCSEKWNNLSPTQDGGYCGSCCKIVIDFTRISDDEILDFFTHKPEHTCGRFRPDQLKIYTSNQASTNVHPGVKLLYAGFLSLLLTVVSRPAFAQNLIGKATSEMVFDVNAENEGNSSKPDHTIKGIVKSDYDETLPGVNIYLKGGTVGTVTDADGKFEFPKKLNAGDILVFCFIGFSTVEYKVPNEPNPVVEIHLEMFEDIMGEVVHDGVYTKRESALQKWWRKTKDLF